MLLDEPEDSPLEFSCLKDDMNEENNSNVHSYFPSDTMTAPKDLPTYSSAAFFSKDVAYKSQTSGKRKNNVFVFMTFHPTLK